MSPTIPINSSRRRVPAVSPARRSPERKKNQLLPRQHPHLHPQRLLLPRRRHQLAHQHPLQVQRHPPLQSRRIERRLSNDGRSWGRTFVCRHLGDIFRGRPDGGFHRWFHRRFMGGCLRRHGLQCPRTGRIQLVLKAGEHPSFFPVDATEFIDLSFQLLFGFGQVGDLSLKLAVLYRRGLGLSPQLFDLSLQGWEANRHTPQGQARNCNQQLY